MSQEFNHIDDLFENLNHFEGNASEQDWQAVLRKMQQETLPVDTVFSKGFETFEGTVTGADWSAIQAKMNTRKRRSVIWYVILPLAILMTGFGTWSVLSDKHKSVAADTPAHTAISGQDKKTGSAESPGTSQSQPLSQADDLNGNSQNIEQNVAPLKPSNNTESSYVSKSHSSLVKVNAGEGEKMSGSKPAGNTGKHAASGSEPVEIAAVQGSEANHRIISPEKTEAVSVPETGKSEAFALADSAAQKQPLLNAADTTEKKKSKDNPLPGKPAFTPAKWRLALNGGLNNTFRTLSGTAGLYDSVRREQESPRLLVSFGMNLEYNISTHWNIGTGLQYNQYGQTANYEYKRHIYDSFPHMDTQGNIIGWFKLNYRDTIENSSQQLVYRYVSVPLNAQYRFKLNSRVTGVAGAAANINVFAGARGKVIQAEQLMGVDDISKMRGKLRDVTISMLLSAGAEYRLSQRVSFGLSMTYMQGAQSYFKQSYPLKEKPRSVGINASLIFHLPNRNIAKPPVAAPKF